MKLSAVMICKNERAVIEKCLRSLSEFDEVIVCDTGSEDNTVELASVFPNVKVFEDYKWQDDFAHARNHALSKVTGDWVMSIDADHELKSSRADIETMLKTAETGGWDVLHIQLVHEASNQRHNAAWLWKPNPNYMWEGKIHEILNVAGKATTNIIQTFTRSPAHNLDPDRNMRILRASPDTPRNRFYLGQALYDAGDYDKAIEAFRHYLPVSNSMPEAAEANLLMARALWWLQRGDEARVACLQAININPMFKEALLFMAEIHFDPWQSKWRKLAECATNEDVLFVRA